MKTTVLRLGVMAAMLPSFLTSMAYVMEHDFTVDNLCYTILDDGKTVAVSHYLESIEGECKIPEKVSYGLSSYTVTVINNSAFFNCENLTTITIPNSVTSIRYEAFYGCRHLTTVTIPKSVKYIGYKAFYECPSIKSIHCQWDEPIAQKISEVSGEFPSFESEMFFDATLYVPKGCVEKYLAVEPWNWFGPDYIVEEDIIGDSTTDIKDIITNQQEEEYIVYNLQGIMLLRTGDLDKVNQLPAGVYIVNGKKMIIR